MNEVTTQRARPPVVQFKQDMARLIEAKELALPDNVSPDAFRNAAIVAVQDNPSILRCSTDTVFRSIRKLAAAGLVPDGREAALVPFKDACTAIPMVFGLIKMARRSGDVKDIRAHTVYQNEFDEGRFEYTVGDEEKLEHRPILFGDKGSPIAYYAIARLKDGTIVRTFMDHNEVEKIRKGAASQGRSQQPKGIWADHYEQMAHKTVIRRLCKRLDLSSEDMRHITMDDEQQAPRDVTPQQQEDTAPRRNLAAAMQQAPDTGPEEALSGEVLDAESADDAGMEPDKTSLEYGEGRVAADNGIALAKCPYEMGEQTWLDWAAGWNDRTAAISKEGGSDA